MQSKDSLSIMRTLRGGWYRGFLTTSIGFVLVAGLLMAAGCNSMNTPMTVAQPQGKLYVAVPFSPPSGNGAIVRLDDPAMLTGNVTPAATISGDQTRFGLGLNGVVVDKMGDRLYALVSTGPSTGAILVFDHASTRSGNVAPDRVIEGSATGLLGTGPFVLDTTRDIAYAEAGADASGDVEIQVFKNVSTLSGNVAPATLLHFSAPHIAASDLLLDEANNRLFALMNDQTISVFDNASAIPSGLLTPNRTIAGANTGLSSVTRMTLDPAGRLLVGNTSFGTPANIVIFADAATANGNVTPAATISGSATALNIGGPWGMAVVTGPGSSASGDLYVNIENGNVLVFKNVATLNGNVTPDHMFSVPSNGSDNLGFSLDTTR